MSSGEPGPEEQDDPGGGSATRLTRSGELVGSLDYLAPERTQGAEPGPPSDVWALGATLYVAVEGAAPFRRTSTCSMLAAIVAEPLPEPHRAGPLAPVLRRLLDKRPDARPDAEEAYEALCEVTQARTPDTPTATLRPTRPRSPEPTKRVTPPAPPGIGPPRQGPAGQVPAPGPAPRAAAPMTPMPSHADGFPPRPGAPTGPAPALAPGAPTGPMSPASGSPRRKGRALLAAGAVAVVLAAAGVTVALVRDQGAPKPDPASAVGRPDDRDHETGRHRVVHATRTSAPERQQERRTQPDGEQSGRRRAVVTGLRLRRAAGRTRRQPDTDRRYGAHTPSPAAACRPTGGGRYDCQVWRAATSYTASGTEAGTLKAGADYFYCQANLGRRETYGRWTNVWWAKTDDDSGNTGVYVSDVYLKGGNNDAPVPGLPVC